MDMNHIFAGIAITLLGGFLNGTFAVFLKYKNPWKWENFWLVYSIVALLIVPFLWIMLVMPHFFDFLLALQFKIIIWPMIFGALWGIGSVLFGLSVERIGLGITFTVVLGLATIIGAVTPLFLNSALPAADILEWFSAGLVIMLAGIALSGRAGYMKEKISEAYTPRSLSRYIGGLFIAIVSGILSPMNNVGFAYGKEIGEMAKIFGASDANATLPTLSVVLIGGFFVNAGYALYLLYKNNSVHLFRNLGKPLVGSIAAGVFWFGGIGFYGIASVFLGNLGTSAGYAILLAFTIIVSNFWGLWTGEWKEAKKAFYVQVVSILILIAGIVVISQTVLA